MPSTEFGFFNGDSWEDFCQQCFKQKYGNDGYQEMPHTHKGDLGIEGYTRTGLIFQCYCPDSEYSPEKLYETQRDKITADLNKLESNQRELARYFEGITITQWIFVTPYYNNKELIKHCRQKAIEFQNKNIAFLSPNFDVLVYDSDYLLPEAKLILQMTDTKIDLSNSNSLDESEIADWSQQRISLVENAIKKNRIRVPTGKKDFDKSVNILTNKTISDFLNNDELIRKWSEKYQDQYEKFQKVIGLFEKEVEEKCAIFDVNNGDSNKLYSEIKDSLSLKLKSSFNYLDEMMIDQLTNRVMADWILRCPISFE